MSTLIQMDHVPAVDRIDFYREMTAAVWVPMECRPGRDADYRAVFRASGRAFRAGHGMPLAEYRRSARGVNDSAR